MRLGLLFPIVLLLAGCPRAVSEPDAGPRPDAGRPRDGGAGNGFEGAIVFDEAILRALDPSTLRAGADPCRPPELVTVIDAIDGDTIYVRSAAVDGTVRLIGVDTPEIAHSGDPADCYGDEAASFTQQLEGQDVWLTFDEECFDRFDRLLAYVHVGAGEGDLWERQLLRRGFATAFTIAPNDQYSSMFNADESVAADDNVGIWSACF